MLFLFIYLTFGQLLKALIPLHTNQSIRSKTWLGLGPKLFTPNYSLFLGVLTPWSSFASELKTIEDSNTRWEAHFPLEDSFVGNPSSVRVFKKNSNIIIEKKVPIPNEVQLATVSAYMKGTFLGAHYSYYLSESFGNWVSSDHIGQNYPQNR